MIDERADWIGVDGLPTDGQSNQGISPFGRAWIQTELALGLEGIVAPLITDTISIETSEGLIGF